MVSTEQELAAGSPAPVARTSRALSRKTLWFALVLFVIVAALFGHIRVASVGPDFTGRLAILDRVFDLVLALAIAALAFCAGRSVCRKLSLSFVGPAEELAFSIMLGTGVIGLIVLGLGLAGLLHPLPVSMTMLLILCLSRHEIPILYQNCNSSLRYARSSRPRLIAALLFGALIALMATRALTPPHCYDEAIYHLAVPKLFVEQGRVYPVVDNFMGDMPFLIHMIYVLCLMAKSDIAAKLFSLVLSVTTGVSLYAFCARFLNRRIGLVALFGFYGAGMVVEVSITARIDVTLAGMIFLALYAMAISLETGRRGWFYCSALLAGVALGIKYTAFIGLFFPLLMYWYESLRIKTRLSAVARTSAAYMGISLALALPWLAKNAVWFHNPIYPYVTGQVAEYQPGKVRYYDHQDQLKIDSFLIEARKQIPVVVGEEEQVLADAASQRMDRNPLRFWEYFTRADKFNVADYYVDPNYLFVVVPLLIFVGRPRWVVWCALAGVAFYLWIAPASWVARYLLPVYPPLTIVSAYVLVSIADRARKHTRLAALLPALVVGISLLSGVLVGCVQIYKELGLNFIYGSLPRHRYMYGSFYFPAIDYINNQIPAGDKVMMIGAEMGYDLDRPYVANAGWNVNEWRRLLVRNDSMEGIRDDLKRNGVRYVLFSPGLFTFWTAVGSQGSGQPEGSSIGHTLSELPFFRKQDSPPRDLEADPDYAVQLRNWATFTAFAARYAEPVKAWRGSYTLYRLK